MVSTSVTFQDISIHIRCRQSATDQSCTASALTQLKSDLYSPLLQKKELILAISINSILLLHYAFQYNGYCVYTTMFSQKYEYFGPMTLGCLSCYEGTGEHVVLEPKQFL